MEVTNRFTGLDLVDRMPEELWTEICNIQHVLDYLINLEFDELYSHVKITFAVYILLGFTKTANGVISFKVLNLKGAVF